MAKNHQIGLTIVKLPFPSSSAPRNEKDVNRLPRLLQDLRDEADDKFNQSGCPESRCVEFVSNQDTSWNTSWNTSLIPVVSLQSISSDQG